MNPQTVLFAAIAIMLLAWCAPRSVHAQNAALVDEAKEKANSIMSDPRLKNMLRTVKEDPKAALDNVKLDPEEAVRQATQTFVNNKDKIDPEKLKSAVAKVKDSGAVEKAMSTLSDAIPGTTATPAEVPAVEAPPVEVPATRPAPGISGGVPTPVAMPVEPGVLPAAEPPGTTSFNPSDAPAIAVMPLGAGTENGTVDVIAGVAPTTPMIPDSPGLTPDDIPEPQPLAKKYAAGNGGAFPSGDKKHMEILSRESIMDNAKGILLFTGDVFIDHPEFEINCDKLEIQMAKGVGMDSSGAGETDGAFKRAIASGGMVEIKRTTVDEKGKNKTQIAIARNADYNAVTKDIILSGGPPYIQDGDRFVKTNSEDAQIIMRGNGMYEITGSSNRSQIVIPVQQKEGKNDGKKKGDSDIGGLGNALGGFR